MSKNVTSLRKSKPTARELLAGIKIIDVDTHISEWPELWTERAPGKLKDADAADRRRGRGPQLGHRRGHLPLHPAARHRGDQGRQQDPRLSRSSPPRSTTSMLACYDVDARLEMMDEQGIHAQIAYPNILGFSGQSAMKTDRRAAARSRCRSSTTRWATCRRARATASCRWRCCPGGISTRRWQGARALPEMGRARDQLEPRHAWPRPAVDRRSALEPAVGGLRRQQAAGQFPHRRVG